MICGSGGGLFYLHKIAQEEKRITQILCLCVHAQEKPKRTPSAFTMK